MKARTRRGTPLKEWLDEELKDPEFKRHYDEAAARWQVAMQVVEARQKANMTQGQLARHIGVKQQNVSRIESGEQNVTIGTLDKIAKAIGGHLVVKIESRMRGMAGGTRAWMLRDRGGRVPYRTKRSRKGAA